MSSFLLHKSEPFLRLWLVMKSRFYTTGNEWPAQWLNREETPKHFLKPNLHQKNVTVTVWWSAARLIHYNFVNPGETIASENYARQIHERHRKLQGLQPALVSRMDPVLFHDSAQPQVTPPMLRKLNKMVYKVLPHLPYSPDLSPTDYHFFKHFNNFLQGKHFHNQQEAENAFQEFLKSQSMGFYTAGINKLIFYWQKCVDCTGSSFD